MMLLQSARDRITLLLRLITINLNVSISNSTTSHRGNSALMLLNKATHRKMSWIMTLLFMECGIVKLHLNITSIAYIYNIIHFDYASGG